MNFFVWLAVYNLSASSELKVVFFDVGQGDAIFIETPKKQQVLIDGGPSSVILEKLAGGMPFYDRTIDLIILTHPEKDHIFGLLEVLKKYSVKNILWTGVVRKTAEWDEWVDLIGKEKADIKIAIAGQKISIGRPGLPIFLEILSPFENLEGREFKDSNETSIVNNLVFGENSFLFTGDIEEKAEKELIAKKINLDSDILKVAHHGSKTSTSLEFLKEVSPEIAIIPVGENSYGHPHPEVLANMKNFGIEILIAKEKGDIKIFSDGKNLKLKTEK